MSAFEAAPRGKVLLVDDSELVRDMIAAYLEDHGWEVATASNGADGLREMRATLPELVLLDLHMPDRDGLQVMIDMRAIDPTLPVILLSGQDDVSVMVDAITAGAFDYQLKASDDLRPLLLALERALRQSRLTRENSRLRDDLERARSELARVLAEAEKLRAEHPRAR